MADATIAAPLAPQTAGRTEPVEFTGSGGEYFRIWIVNLALTLITLGIYSAWAKVRTRRYMYGNTWIAGHAFDYHASPIRILIGRIIALLLLGGYELSALASPLAAAPWYVVFAFAIPWLIVASQRFNARNTSYRNVRFNFTGTYGSAFTTFILWPLFGGVTLGILIPLAHRAREYFLIDNRTFGGKRFKTRFAGKDIYKIYGIALLLFLLALIVLLVAIGVIVGAATASGAAADDPRTRAAAALMGFAIAVPFIIAWVGILTYIGVGVLNLALNNTVLDDRHRLYAKLLPWAMLWIALTNLIGVLFTVGLFYPWARIRIARYMADRIKIDAATSLDEFTSEAIATQGAIGEEVAAFFDFDIGL